MKRLTVPMGNIPSSSSLSFRRAQHNGIWWLVLLFVLICAAVLLALPRLGALQLPAPDGSAAAAASQQDQTEPQPQSEPASAPDPEPFVFQTIIRAPQVEDLGQPGYFTGTLFLGDSLTEGLLTYGLLDDATVIAERGMTVQQMLCQSNQNAIAQHSTVQRVFVLLGINDLTNYNEDTQPMVDRYGTLIDQLHALLPDADIYIQSVFPLASFYNNQANHLTLARIQQYNRQLQQMVNQKAQSELDELGMQHTFYLDLYTCWQTDAGYLPSAVTSDGLHIKASYYNYWLNLLIDHASQVDTWNSLHTEAPTTTAEE